MLMSSKRGPASPQVDAVSQGNLSASSGAPDLPSTASSPAGPQDIIPYVAPMFAYLVFSQLEGYLPKAEARPNPLWYPLAYTVKFLVVAVVACWYRSTWRDLAPFPGAKALSLAVLTGLMTTGFWVGLEGLYPALPLLGQRVAFDPNVLAPGPRWVFIIVRMLGLALLVPLIEELFWRSFLVRWLIDQDFQRVPIGRVTPFAGAATSVLFALVHPEWLPALITGLLWAWLLWQTRSVSACVVSHAVANFTLGVYVLISGDWKYW